MSNEKLIIPKKCKVGFNLRNDTYTGKLGYIIYNDGKVWRKENSWESWRQKEGKEYYNHSSGKKEIIGDELNPIEFDNIPMSGFVLNKKAGGTNSGWNHRATYCRVYDPRGFEFEINIPNLLFILQETNSMKGKGLEGEFVYAWDGKDLVMLPCDSQDYQKSQNFTDLQFKKVASKDLILGATYLTNKAEKVIYLGKLDYHNNSAKYIGEDTHLDTSYSKQFIFVNTDNLFIPKKSISGYIKDCIDETCNDQYTEFVVDYDKSINGQKIISLETADLLVEDLHIVSNYYVTLIEGADRYSTFVKDNKIVTILLSTVKNNKTSFYLKEDSYYLYNVDKMERVRIYSSHSYQYSHEETKYYATLEELINSNEIKKMYFVTEKGNRIINNIL